jgi:hypothetical protein
MEIFERETYRWLSWSSTALLWIPFRNVFPMGTCWLYFVVVVRGRAAVAKRKETGNQKYINFGRKNFKMCTETFFLSSRWFFSWS